MHHSYGKHNKTRPKKKQDRKKVRYVYMKRYEVTTTYIIEAYDETHLQAILYNATKFPSTRYEWQLVRKYYKELPKVQRRAVRKRRNRWLAILSSQVRYLVLGK